MNFTISSCRVHRQESWNTTGKKNPVKSRPKFYAFTAKDKVKDYMAVGAEGSHSQESRRSNTVRRRERFKIGEVT